MYGVASSICPKQFTASLYSYHRAFSSSVLLESKEVKPLQLTCLQFGRIPLFNFIIEIRFPYGRYPVKSSLCFIYAYADIAFSRWDTAIEVYKLDYSFLIIQETEMQLGDKRMNNCREKSCNSNLRKNTIISGCCTKTKHLYPNLRTVSKTFFTLTQSLRCRICRLHFNGRARTPTSVLSNTLYCIW